tara:strand:+ start:660 stop:833 length:174 start_codon:yes stop_codon:yes gene_type:complete
MYGKRKKMMGGGKSKMPYKHGGPAGHDGNKHARREYKYGGSVQPEYGHGECPKASAN